MSGFQHVIGRFPGMRKDQEWIVYPAQPGDNPNLFLIQSDTRCARVDVSTGDALVSSGKGGHPGFHTLSPQLGAKVVKAPENILDQLQELLSRRQVGDIHMTGEKAGHPVAGYSNFQGRTGSSMF